MRELHPGAETYALGEEAPGAAEGEMSMGIYVSEINMPKGVGSKLVLQIFPDGGVYDAHGIRLGIANWAKAVPVPPHGRLADLDMIENEIARLSSEDYTTGGIRLILDYAPVVIPAEPPKEEE